MRSWNELSTLTWGHFVVQKLSNLMTENTKELFSWGSLTLDNAISMEYIVCTHDNEPYERSIKL